MRLHRSASGGIAPNRLTRGQLASAAVLIAALTVLAPTVAARTHSHESLGPPALAGAQRYILAPASRSVLPVGVTQATAVDDDFVAPSSPVSETDAHGLDPGTSSTTQTDGVAVREAGPDQPIGYFSYVLHVPEGQDITVRVEEAGSATSDYWVLINGVDVYHRTPDPRQSGTWDGLDGLVHYEFTVPAALIAARAPGLGEMRITFQNTDDPGDGARIAGVWAITAGGQPAAPYGGAVQGAASATSPQGMTLRSNIFGRPFAIFDFGHEVGGKVQMTLANSGRASTLGLAFSESSMYMTTASDFSEDSAAIATETHYYNVPTGTNAFTDPVIRGGFRYLMVFLDAPGTIRISNLRLDFTPSPTASDLRDYKGAFLSASDELNRLWYSAAYTLQMDTIDPHTGRAYPAQPGPVENNATIASGPTAVVDGAKRDRMDWVGDQAVEDPTAYLTSGDTLSAKDSFEFMGSGAASDGEVPGIYLPGSGYNYGWGEYAAWWIYNYWNYYLYTGDRAFLDRWFATMQRDVGWFESLVGADGLVDVPGSAGGHWGYGNSGEETYDNALYVWALQAAAKAADAEGDPALATQYQSDAQRTTTAINAKLWDPQAGAYVVDPSDGAHPQDGNVMAILAGVATGSREASVLKFLTSQWTPYGADTIDASGNIVAQYVSPFVSYFELLAYASQNATAGTDDAMTLIARTWDPMISGDTSGTLWENLSLSGAPQLGSYTSLSHGWSTGVVPFLTNVLLGVTPTAGGFSSFQVLPHPPSNLPWAEGAVPTPSGPVTASWRQDNGAFSVTVSAPAGTTYTAGVPDSGVQTVSDKGRTVWSGGAATAADVVDQGGYIELTGATGETTLRATYNR